MSEIHVTVSGGLYRYGPGIVRIGRSSENDIVVNDPTVSRRHAQISLEAEGWVWQNLGQAPTFLGGQPVARFVVADLVEVNLSSPQGPAIRLQSAPDAAQPGVPGRRADANRACGSWCGRRSSRPGVWRSRLSGSAPRPG